MSEQPRLIIVGWDDFAAEIYSWMELDSEDSPYVFGGYLYDERDVGFAEDRSAPERLIAGSVQRFEPLAGDVLVLGLAEPIRKMECARILEKRGGNFICFVHPTAVIAGPGPRKGVVIGPYATLGDETIPDDFTYFGAGCYVGTRVIFNQGCTLHDNVAVFRGVHFGRGVEVGSSGMLGQKIALNGFSKVEPGCLVLEDVPEHGRVTREYDEGGPVRR